MNSTSTYLSYKQTGCFTNTIIDYIDANEKLIKFTAHPVSMEGVKSAIEARKHYNTDRKLLVEVLKKQYASITSAGKVKSNIDLLLKENTFTITTAHQPVIFTGPLYFIYKILHVIRLASLFNDAIPGNHFVPVFYMGSEDADLDELGHIYIEGEKQEWKTNQEGAVGRMKVDEALIKIIEKVSGQLLVHPFGEEIIHLVKEFYIEGISIEQATFKFVHHLFAEYGLLILLPDNEELKRSFIPVMKRELTEEFSHQAVKETIAMFPKIYNAQASGRQLNLFYLDENKRERIERKEENWSVVGTDIRLSKDQLLTELNTHPERFSPNVILRPVFQEMILPNIVFIGGGGEIAYWLELKKVFEETKVPFPLMVLRNSFMIVPGSLRQIIYKLELKTTDLFRNEMDLLNELVKRDSKVELSIEKEKEQLKKIYQEIRDAALKADNSLAKHTETLQAKALQKIETLEKKMLKAERKRFEAQQRQLHKMRSLLFPNNGLQERIDNLLIYYSKWGNEFIKMIYKHSKGLEQEFCVIIEK